MLERNPEIPYVQTGRNETEEQAREKDQQLKAIFHDNAIPYVSFVVDGNVEDRILEHIEKVKLGS
jgi:hypothetical protein